MAFLGKAKRVRIYVAESTKIGHQPAYAALVELLRREGAHGATAFRAVEGYGATGHVHVSHLVDVADVPVLVEWIDTPEMNARLLPRVEAALPHGFATVDDTEIVLRK